MANIGSVFLGDVARHRMFANSPHSSPSSSPPPSSPPPSSIAAVFPRTLSHSPPTNQHPTEPMTTIQSTPIDPRLALDLRLRWLEALLVGVGGVGVGRSKPAVEETHASTLTQAQTLCRTAEDLQRRLDTVVATNDELKRFLAQYDQNAHLLTPAFALSLPGLDAAEGSTSMSPAQLEALLAEMEPDIRAAERDMREIELLESKGVTGAGKLGSYEELQPRLDKLIAQHRADAELAASLERRTAALVERHATQVDALSELFVVWDDTITEVEDKITRLEKECNERRRLGLEQ
ncbi:hypothetical protein H0H87_008405 [Tephrocybe sp. NHM501043]|nr:hypothetical protein H0H87_008405 [Tephrocybe sp. NHM501043]